METYLHFSFKYSMEINVVRETLRKLTHTFLSGPHRYTIEPHSILEDRNNIISTVLSSSYNIEYANVAVIENYHEDDFKKSTVYNAEQQHIIRIPGLSLLDLETCTFYKINNNGLISIIPETVYQQVISYIEPSVLYRQLASNMLRSIVSRTDISEHISDPAETLYFPMLSKWSYIYFHTISECLVQLHSLEHANLPVNLTGLYQKQLRSTQSIAINFSNFPKIISKNKYIILSDSIVYTGMYNHAAINEQFVNTVSSIVDRYKSIDCNKDGKLLYVTRLNSKNRPLLNEQELINRASSIGYDIVDPGNLSFRDQVRLFSTAKVVAGPHGSGLANAAFCPSGSTLIEFRPVFRSRDILLINETYRRIAASTGLKYDCSISENTDAEWTIDVNRAEQILQKAAKS